MYLASNVDCTIIFIVYMYAHLHNMCMCLLLCYAGHAINQLPISRSVSRSTPIHWMVFCKMYHMYTMSYVLRYVYDNVHVDLT